MSRDFNGTSQYGVANEAVASSLTDYPFTIAFWFHSPNRTSTAVTLTESSGYTTLWAVETELGGAGGHIISRAPYLQASNTFTADAWMHACLVATSSTTFRVVLNGDWASSGSTTGASVAFDGASDDVVIGALVNGDGPINYFDGMLAHVAVWKVALSQSEVESLYNGGGGGGGKNPLAVQNANLIGYWPLAGDASPEPDSISGGGTSITLTGSPPQGASDPTVDAPPATGAPRAAAYYRMMRNR